GSNNLPVPPWVSVQNPKVGQSRPAMVKSHTLEPAVASPSPSSSFPALEDNLTDCGPAGCAPENPPDTQGAVGPNHLMVTVNSEVRIQSRGGASLGTVTLDKFWQDAGIVEAFDPKLVYDPYANRWIFVALSDMKLPSSSILVAVSSGIDPTG